MNQSIDHTHNPDLRSWVESANQPDTDFPIQNLPFGVFRRRNSSETPHIGVAMGDRVLDLALIQERGILKELPEQLQTACKEPQLNSLMALGTWASSSLRDRLSKILSWDSPKTPEITNSLLPMDEIELLLPAKIGDYTDFYSSIFHATNVGKLFRPDNPLLPNYKYVPIAYHGRASSIVISGTSIKRPHGQQKIPQEQVPTFGASKLLDYEVELGFFVGTGNQLGQTIPIEDAQKYIFGLCLVNDWSARDIQAWEYQPLGPFLGKSFATSISPWVVTLEALAPFRCPSFSRPEGDPVPLPYLTSSMDKQQGGTDITLEMSISSLQMRQENIEPLLLSRASFSQMYWTLAQMLTHHSSNGCNLCPGDLIASGTVSGAEEGSKGSLLEISQRGSNTITLPSGEKRKFLVDGDEVILRGYCQKKGSVRIGFGECRGIVMSADS